MWAIAMPALVMAHHDALAPHAMFGLVELTGVVIREFYFSRRHLER
jgi:hypothetical protein